MEFAEKMVFFTGGILAGIITVHLITGRSVGSKSENKYYKGMKPLDLRKDLKKTLSAYSDLEYYNVAASLRNILHNDLNKDGTEKVKVIPKSLQIEIEKRLHLTPAIEEEKNETDAVLETDISKN
jgi:hypothetical protein